MNATLSCTDDEMYRAMLDRDCAYEGIFFFAVRTTGVFCRCTCAARRPLRRNVRFFESTDEALRHGYRPCRRCRPMEVPGTEPAWISSLLQLVDDMPHRRWTDRDLRGCGVDPTRAARWFKANHGTSLQGFLRSRRLARALRQLANGDDMVAVAVDSGYESLSGFRDAFQKWCGTTPGRIDKATRVLTWNRVASPLGPLVAAADQNHLYLVEFADRRTLQSQMTRLATRLSCRFAPGTNRLIDRLERELEEYFAGTRDQFTVSVALCGTDFQRSVWQALQRIPFGETATYEKVAKTIGKPRGARAVGRANGDNRLAILVPCHRVLRSDGNISGYAGGVQRKQWMVRHERAVLRRSMHDDHLANSVNTEQCLRK